MATIVEVQFETIGFPGAPGFTTMYFEGASQEERDAATDHVTQFMTVAKTAFPTNWAYQIKPECRVLEDTTGALLDIHTTSASNDDQVLGLSAGTSFGPGPSGACMSWRTATTNWSRRVRGRTFFVPLAAAMYDANGTLNGGLITALNGAAVTLIAHTEGRFGIWSRPRAGAGGKFALATTGAVKDQAAILRSRRT